jgi:tRNA dimethylallyltransferase
MRPEKRAVLIAGPTASGKSRLALRQAEALGAVVVNADAMQVYGLLRVLTARPSPEEVGGVPHRLYGTVDPGTRFSTGAWRRAAAAELAAAGDRPVVFVGGTGLYFEALEHGFAEVPPVPAEAVAAAERELAGLDVVARARLLAARDPQMAARLRVPDPQRAARALAVLAATGQSLASFQDAGQGGLLAGHTVDRIVLDPGRDVVRERIATRFAAMLEGGAVEEVEALLALNLDPGLPAMKAIGVREIAAWLRGDIAREAALARSVIATRQYAKRQRTWFRGRMAGWRWVGGDG